MGSGGIEAVRYSFVVGIPLHRRISLHHRGLSLSIGVQRMALYCQDFA
jgi:hypothetical protein